MPHKGYKFINRKSPPPFTEEHRRKMGLARKGHIVKQSTRIKISKSRTGLKQPQTTDEKNPKWKGNQVSYTGLHQWVARKLGKPHSCAYCNDESKPHRQYMWANISRTYKRDLSDWIRLCAKCHKAYDLGKIEL